MGTHRQFLTIFSNGPLLCWAWFHLGWSEPIGNQSTTWFTWLKIILNYYLPPWLITNFVDSWEIISQE
jgi:hypothetical protein